MNKHHRKVLYAVLSVALSTLATGFLVEAALRVIINGRPNMFSSAVRRPELYAKCLDEDYWKLRMKMEGRYKPPKNPKDPKTAHPLLGWVGWFNSKTLIHKKTPEIGERRPVLLYGDSFAQCVTKDKFQNLLNSDAEFSGTNYLLNYGVGGYGLCQISLLLENTIHLYEDPIVILSFMTMDLDRSLMSYRIGQKPYFRRVDDVVQQITTPIDTDPDRFLERNPPQIPSYALALLARRRFVPSWIRFKLDQVPGLEEIKAVNSHLIRDAVSMLRENGVPFCVVVFHPYTEMGLTIFDSDLGWRSDLIYETLTDIHAPYISTRELVQSDASTTGRRFRADYFLKNDAHPNEQYNRLVADKIKSFVLSQSGRDAADRNVGNNKANPAYGNNRR
jgi:hypothetical protein